MGARRIKFLVIVMLAGLLAAATLLAAGAGAKRKHPKFVVGKNNLVAPLVIPANPRPGPVPHCHKLRLKCVRNALRRLRTRESDLGCDHRAVFATTYRVLTEALLKTMRDNPAFFRFPRYFFAEDALFAGVYIANGRAWNRGRRVSPAWQIAFSQAADGDLNAAQDMLLGINAHVQNDMPFVLASLSTHTRKGYSRKADHDKANDVLASAYERVVSEVKARYDPVVELTNSPLTPLDDAAGLELVKQWRETVWTNANRLLAAKTPAEKAQVITDIEDNAADWAQMIAAVPSPGYRAQRDAYCATHNPDA
jgi:hypothetical protein